MALILRRSVMVHIPRTGGTWAYAALHRQGLVRAMLWSADDNPHPFASETKRIIRAFTFAFVRAPVAWLRSYWAASFIRRGYGIDRLRFGSTPWHEFAQCEAPSFLEFACAYLERCPGAVGRMFLRYVEGADFVGRHEALPGDLCAALAKAKETFDAEAIAATPRENQSASFALGPLAEIPPSIGAAIARAESPLLSMFYPSLAEGVA